MAEFGLPSFVSAGGTRPVFTVYRYDDVAAGLRDHETFASSLWLDLLGPITGRTVLGMDGEEHRRWRGLLLPVFSRKAVETWEETVVRPAARQAVAELRSRGNGADLIGFAQRFPIEVIYQILGLPVDDELYDHFETLALTMLLAFAPQADSSESGGADTLQAAIGAAAELGELIEPIVTARRSEGSTGDDLIGQLLRTEFEGRRLDDEQITSFVRSLLPAATDNTTRQLLITAALLLERPDALRAVRDDRSLLPAATLEAERYDGPVAVLSRIATREVEVAGVTIPAGAGVSFAVNSANRDETVFVDPDRFDIGRAGPKPLTWGWGRHVCPAMNTGRSEIKVGIEALLDGLPGVRLDPDAEPPIIRGLHTRSPAGVHVVWN
jgi:cytochrome P450